MLIVVVVVLAQPGTPSPPPGGWYAAGVQYEHANDVAQGNARLIGPFSMLGHECRQQLAWVEAGHPTLVHNPPVPPLSAKQSWLNGCQAGYLHDHPDQQVINGLFQ
ncbi:MAG: hypothetical protein ACLQDY_02815 [Streptosporangiaceae bacterium]